MTYQGSSSSGGLPLGVAVLAILIGLVGFFFLLVGLFAIVAPALLAGYAFFGPGLVGGLIVLILGIVLLAVASGLWNQELWALALAILVLVLLLAVNVYHLLEHGSASLLAVLIEVVLIIYLVAVSNHFS